jgi:hypothetical protein
MVANFLDDYQPPPQDPAQQESCSPCPTCGRPADPPRSASFDPNRSALLDWIEVLEHMLHELKRAVEGLQPASSATEERRRALITWADVAHRWRGQP